jgi:hypothetical protein
MYRPLIALPTLTLITATLGCAGGAMGPMPPVVSGQPPVTVTVQRSKSLVGAPASMLFKIDGRRVYALRLGQQFSFSLDPGEYNFGYDLGFNECGKRVLLDPGQAYLVRMTPVCQFEVSRLGPTG